MGSLRPSSDSPENISRIHDVGFYSLTSNSWDEQPSYSGSDQFGENNVKDTYTYTTNQGNVLEHPCAPLMKILSMGTFYYAPSPQWDLSSRLIRRVSRGKQLGVDPISYDERFVWNEYIVRSLLDFRDNLDLRERRDLDQCQFIVSWDISTIALYLICIDFGYPRIRRYIHCGSSRSSYKRNADHRNYMSDFSPRQETCRDTFQHAGDR